MSSIDHLPTRRPFTGMALDRVSVERKDPAWVRSMIRDSRRQAVAAGHQGVLITDGQNPALARVNPAPARLVQPILLGTEDGHGVFALDLDLDEDASAVPEVDADGARIVSLRDAGLVLSPAEAGLAAYATALLNWHRRHRFCANCGAGTDIAEAGYSRHCPRCGATHFPRTDPVVIMTVEHRERLLLGRRAGWPPGRLSVLAGFISPGEAAEEAVLREVQEESGIVAFDPVFVTSQPWPFPASLMLGFHAQAEEGEPRARDGELDEVHWLEFGAVRQATRDENPDFKLPPRVSIARFLIERWVTLRGT